MNGNSKIAYSIITSIVVFIFALIINYIPLCSLMAIFMPLPFIVCGYKVELNYSIISIFIATFAISIINSSMAILFLIVLFIPAILIGINIRKYKNPFNCIFIGFVGIIFGILICINLYSAVLDINVIDKVMAILKESLQAQEKALMDMNISISSIDFKELLNYIEMTIPSTIIMYSLIVSFINYFFAINILSREAKNEGAFPKLNEFTLPGNIIIGIAIIYMLSYLLRYIPGIHYNTLMLNVEIVFLIMFFLQGLALYSHLLNKLKIRTWIKNVLLLFSIFMQPIPIIISLMGFVDGLFDFRKIRN